MNYIIGCGGVGSAIVPSFCLLVSPRRITLVDGDSIERKNLNRQMFDVREDRAEQGPGLGDPVWLPVHPGMVWSREDRLHRSDWLICLVDNHRTRLETLEVCDQYGTQAIFAANEMHSSEAYYYRRTWKGSPRDPRVYYPEINTDASGDPRAASIGCTGELQEIHPQLVSANLMAAALAEHLFVLWYFKAPRMDMETVAMLPHKFGANLSKLETYKGGSHE